MWEDSLECVRVRNRRASEVRSPDEVAADGEEESPDIWEEVVVEDDGDGDTQFIPLQKLDETDRASPPRAERANHRGSGDSPEVVVASDWTPRRLILSGWGQSLQGRQRWEIPHSSTCSYALLSAEIPFFQERVLTLTGKFAKGVEAIPMSWNQPDLKILYQFATREDYLRMASNLKEGRLSRVKGYRAVSLEPVRLIDGSLKASLEFTFPFTVSYEIKTDLKPLLDSVATSQHFLYMSTDGQKLPKDDPPTDTIPSLLLTFISSQSLNSTAMKVQSILSQPQWSFINLSGVLGSLNSPIPYDQVYLHSRYRGILPLFSLATGQAGRAMEDSIRLTLLCGSKLQEMTRFYQRALATPNPFMCPSHTIFALVSKPVSTLELCLLESPPSLHTLTLKHPVLHIYVDDIAMVTWQLGRDGHALERLEGYNNHWTLTDPCGNRVALVDKSGLES